MNFRASIALQEVPRGWEGKLHCFFSKNNYTFITSLYGHEKNDYMGVGIAIPTDTYSIEDCEIIRVSDTHRFQLPPQSHIGWIDWFSNKMRIFLGYKQDKTETVDTVAAKWRHNTMIFIRLLDLKSKETICFANYHMPCMYRRPKVMSIHASLCAKQAQKLANNDALVLAGDWNFGPESEMYKLITTGKLPEDSDAFPDLVEGDTFDFDLEYPLSSAYADHSREPSFTNHALIMLPWEKDIRDPFTGCLDYLFFDRRKLEVSNVITTPTSTESLGGVLPTLEEPSDHLMIGASFHLR